MPAPSDGTFKQIQVPTMKLRRSWRVWTLLLVVLAAAGAAIFAFSSDDVVVVKPAYGPAVQAIYATGRVEPAS